MLANIYVEQEKFAEAVKQYENAVNKFKKFRRAHRMLAQLLVRQGEFKKALPHLKRVIELGGGDGFTYGALGLAYTNAEDFLLGESAFRMASLLQPEIVNWRLGLAHNFFKQERFAAAISIYDKLIKNDPTRAEYWLAQGEAYGVMNKPLKAIENFELVDRLGGSTVKSLNDLGDLYAMQKMFAPAVDAYIRALKKEQNPSPARAMHAAKIISSHGAVAETKKLVLALEEHCSQDMDEAGLKDILRLRARLAGAEGATELQAKLLKEMCDLDPQDGDAFIRLGKHHELHGNPELAIINYERAAALDQFKARAQLAHAELLVRQERYADALPLIRSSLKLERTDAVEKFLKDIERVSRRSR